MTIHVGGLSPEEIERIERMERLRAGAVLAISYAIEKVASGLTHEEYWERKSDDERAVEAQRIVGSTIAELVRSQRFHLRSHRGGAA